MAFSVWGVLAVLCIAASAGIGWCAECPLFSTPASAGDEPVCTCDVQTHNTPDMYGNGTCFCRAGQYMNRVAEYCEDCSDSEDCEWSIEQLLDGRSLQPPDILPGYWAQAVAVADRPGFAKHSIYECVSSQTCLANGQCAAGRQGVACGDCAPGHYGGPDETCKRCDGPPSTYRMLLGAIYIGMVMCVLGVAWTSEYLGRQSDQDVASLSLLVSLKSFALSGKQILQHVQLLALVSFFRIKWPDTLKRTFAGVADLTIVMNNAGSFPIGCLADSQNVDIVMGFKWYLPLAFCVAVSMTIPLSWAIAFALGLIPHARVQQISKKVSIKPLTALRIYLFVFSAAFATTSQNALLLLSCISGPNGLNMVRDFRSLECESPHWWHMLSGLWLAVLFYVIFFILIHLVMLRAVVLKLQESQGVSRGPWGVMADDFRTSHVYFPLFTIGRDLMITLIAVSPFQAFQAGWQLALTIGVLGLYLRAVMRAHPFCNPWNNYMEVGSIGLLLVETILVGSLGFHESPVPSGPECLAIVMVAGLVMLLAIFFVQLMSTFPVTDRMVPRCLKPMSEERFRERIALLFSQAKDVASLEQMFHQLDVVERASFDRTLGYSVALNAAGVFRPRASEGPFSSMSPERAILRRLGAASKQSETEGNCRSGDDEEHRAATAPAPDLDLDLDLDPEKVEVAVDADVIGI